MAQMLWRVQGELTTPDRDEWQEGLILHLLFQPLTLIVLRREGQSRHYLSLQGCPRCRPDGCERVCHRVLFEQLVRTTLPSVTLVPTPRLLAQDSERRQVLATPHRPDAQLLDAAFLAQWAEGRLITTWSRLRATAQPIMIGAQLAVGEDGPAPRRALQAVGWRTLPVASLLSRRASKADVPPPVRVGSRAGEALFAALRDPRTLTGAPRQANTATELSPGPESKQVVVSDTQPNDHAQRIEGAVVASSSGEA